MARERFYHDPARKHIETQQDFSGGLNTMSANDNVKDNELVQLENIDLGERGSLKRRKGYYSIENPDAEGTPQGIFRYYKRHTPYNLLGAEGTFEGAVRKVGNNVSIGNWYTFGLVDEENAYKVPKRSSHELIHNGDFELGDEGWVLNEDEKEVGDAEIVNSNHSVSEKSVLRLRLFRLHSGFITQFQDVKHRFSVKEGDEVHVNVKYRRAALSVGNAPYRVHAVARIYMKDGSIEHMHIRKYDCDGKWRTLEGVFEMPKNAEYCLLGLGMLDRDIHQTTAVYFDDFYAYHVTYEDLSLNGNFEKGDNGDWELNASDKRGWESSILKSNHAIIPGQYVMRIGREASFDADQAGEYQRIAIPTKEGDKFEAKVMYRAATKAYGQPAHAVQIVALVEFEDGSITRIYRKGYNLNYTWQELKATFTMPEKAKTVRFGLSVFDGTTPAKVGAYFDNFSVYKKNKVSRNARFDKGRSDWNLNAAQKYRAGESEVMKSQVAFAGENVLRIRRYRHHGGYYNEYQQSKYKIKVKEGDQIYAEAMYRAGGASLGAIPKRIHLVANVFKHDGTSERLYINRFDASRTWKKVSGVFTMPENAAYVRLGVGIRDDETDEDVVAYFDMVYARKVVKASMDSALAIRTERNDPHTKRGLGLQFEGLEPNKYYLYLVEYKTDGQGIGALEVRDERYGVYPDDNGLIMQKRFEDAPTEWTTKYMKFQTYDGMTKARAYVLNRTPLGEHNVITYFDEARIYELTAEEYEKIDVDPEYTGEKLAEKFPFRVGILRNESRTETITVIGGKFYIDGIEKPVLNDPYIQSERPMEAVSYRNNLYIASGSGLLVYNGSTIALQEPYQPTPLETLYVGTNGLLENPYEISDREQSTVQLYNILFNRRYGETNKDITITVAVGKPSGLRVLYKFERRNVRDKEGYWRTIQDWSTDNTVTFSTKIAGEYQFRISVKEDGKEDVLDEYIIPKYIIKPASTENDLPIDANTISLCNRILLHWDRLYLYGDPTKPDVVYISDLYNPAYFPTNNTLKFDNPRKESLTKIVKYRDSLVAFTPTSIQALHGTNPENYERYILNSDIGCIAPNSIDVVQNYIVFLSYDGISLLKSVGTSELRYNVATIDQKVKNQVSITEDAVSYVRKNQYHIVFPKEKKQLRYYYEWDTWTLDVSNSLDFVDVVVEKEKIFALGSDGRVVRDSDDYADEGVPFEAIISTKMFTFGETYSTKKLRELRFMIEDTPQPTNFLANVFLDNRFNPKEVQYTQDFEHEYEYREDEHTWEFLIRPSHTNTIKKGFAHDDFGSYESVSNFAQKNNAFLVLSGSSDLQGLQIMHNVVYQNGDKTNTLAIMNDGTLKILDESDSLDEVKHTFYTNDYFLVKDGNKWEGVPSNEENGFDIRKARQGIGQKADGTIVVLVVGADKSEDKEGVTVDEFAQMFIERDCVNAYELSSDVYVWFNGETLDTYSDGKEHQVRDFLYFSNDVVDIVEGSRRGVIKSEVVSTNPYESVYRVQAPGKGLTIGSLISHQENKPFKLVGVAHVFKLKKP